MLLYLYMSLSKQVFEKYKMYDDSENNHYEIILYTKGYDKQIKKSSLNIGGVLDLTSRKKNRRKRVVLER
jgi:hypothetical protein